MVVVCGAPERPAAVGFDLVRERAGVPSEEHAAAGGRDGPHRSHVPAVLACVHRRAAFLRGTNPSEAVHQVLMPLCELFHVPM